MSILIIMLPLISAIMLYMFGFYLGSKGSVFFSVLCMIISSILSIIVLFEALVYRKFFIVSLSEWIDSGFFFVNWNFLFDSLSITMLVVISIISTLVHIYSYKYMKNDFGISRFMSYLSLFTFFMCIFVTADNFIQLFIGWEGIGICSYLLISFWFARLQATKAALKAIILNRIGDIGLIIGILLIYNLCLSVDFAVVFSVIPYYVDEVFILFGYEINYITLICFFLFMGTVAKSSQLALHVWLPDAMEGPTPVSALIHAATMVTAGIFLIMRCSPIFEYSLTMLIVIAVVGGLTAFFSATAGALQNDLKKVIAFSTCSQLGYMVFICGLSQYTIGFYHLVNHAFFKALLFLGAGVVIHALNDEQDMRKMGGLVRILPLTYSLMVIGSLSLMGFPFLTGFYSKDLILEVAYSQFIIDARFVYWLGTISAFFTAFYSIRLLYLTFLAKPNGSRTIISSAHEGSWWMLGPLVFLGFCSIGLGYYIKDFMVGYGQSFYADSIYSHNLDTITAEFLPYYIKIIPVVFSLGGALIALIGYFFYMSFITKLKLGKFNKIYHFLNSKWYFDILYNKFIGLPVFKFGYNITFLVFDKGLFELIGPVSVIKNVEYLVKNVHKMHSGLLSRYLCLFIFFVFLLYFFYVGWKLYLS